MGLHDFFQINILTIGIFVFMTILITANKAYEIELAKHFIPMIVALFFIIIIDNLDFLYYETNVHDFRHLFVATTGYNLRIAILMYLLDTVVRKEKEFVKKLLQIPGIICIGITTLALFTKLVYWFDENGNMVRGTFAYVPHITLGLYAFLLIMFGIERIINKQAEEGAIIITGCLFNIISTYAEFKYRYRGLLMGTIALIIAFYYLFLHAEYLKKDVLTDIYNRISYQATLKKESANITGIIMIDLNNLKTLNDTFGHEEGDKALKALARNVEGFVPRGCKFFRTGGDEFTVIQFKDCKINLPTIANNILMSSAPTPYKWAVGYASVEENDGNIKNTIKMADMKMYENKQKLKKK